MRKRSTSCAAEPPLQQAFLVQETTTTRLLPFGVTYYASGSSEVSEIRGFLRAGVGIGVEVSKLRGPAIRELLDLAGTGATLFCDSGAFSECGVRPDGSLFIAKKITHVEWLERLALYLDLARELGSQLTVVAPDRVADQEMTLFRLRRYRDQLAAIEATGARIVIPVQRGELSPVEFFQAAAVASGLQNLAPALPSNKAPMTPQEVIDFVQTIRPSRVHLLGMGPNRHHADVLIRAIQHVCPGIELTMDSNRIKAVMAEGRIGTETQRQSQEYLECDETEGDPTENAQFPSSWATKVQLSRIAAGVGLSPQDRQSFMEDPDSFVADLDEDEYPYLFEWLSQEYDRHLQGSKDNTARTVAIAVSSDDNRIAGQYFVPQAGLWYSGTERQSAHASRTEVRRFDNYDQALHFAMRHRHAFEAYCVSEWSWNGQGVVHFIPKGKGRSRRSPANFQAITKGMLSLPSLAPSISYIRV